MVAAVKGFARDRRQIAPGCADQFDRACDRPRAERTRPATARHPHRRQPIGRKCIERDIAEERIGQRNAVEQHQRPARGIAAERAQRHALRAGVGRAAVGSAKLLETGDVVQHVLDSPRRIPGEARTIDRDRAIGGNARRQRQRLAADDDIGVVGRRQHALLRGAAGAETATAISGITSSERMAAANFRKGGSESIQNLGFAGITA